MEKPTPMSVL
nr:unnamed protein product [Callosobruchus chinensis]